MTADLRSEGSIPTPSSLSGMKVTVVGLGRFGGGIGATKWLCSQGADVTVSDKAGSEELAGSLEALAGLNVALHLGSHEEPDFTDAELLVVSPAVPRDLPQLLAAAKAGIPRTSEINLFLERCPAPAVGVTGSVGKSTTTAMAGQILTARYCTHVGGNIGKSLLETLPEIRGDHIVVLELSSFQLEDLPLIGISPHVALVTNLQPNHLDRHGTMEAYAQAKRNIFRYQTNRDVLILNAAQTESAAWASQAPGRVELFDPNDEPFELSIPGAHNQANAQAAWAIARQFDIERDQAAKALQTFVGLPHRLQFVGQRRSVRYFNDSKCTTPAGAIVALEAFEPGRAVIIVGGYDKNVSFEALGAAIARRAKAVIAIGATRAQIMRAVEAHRDGRSPAVAAADDLASAVRLADEHAHAGDVVLLSPACASYDMFANYEQRGELFEKLVRPK